MTSQELLNNILIVEDKKNDVDIVLHYLTKAYPDSVFTVCNSVAEFKEKYQWTIPDLIICDFDLPDGNGLEILLHVKSTATEIPFIYFSGTLSSASVLGDAILHGASGYLLKENVRQLPEQVEKVVTNFHQKISKKQKVQDIINEVKLKSQQAAQLANECNNDKLNDLLQSNLTLLNEL